jgi:hypothetical protein
VRKQQAKPAIKANFERRGFPDPTARATNPIVRNTLDGAARQYSVVTTRCWPYTLKMLDALAELGTTRTRRAAVCAALVGFSLRDLRDLSTREPKHVDESCLDRSSYTCEPKCGGEGGVARCPVASAGSGAASPSAAAKEASLAAQ